MLELHSLPVDVVGCFGRPDALESLAADGELSVRVGPDELLLLGRRDRLTELEAELDARDEHGLAVDLSGGFAVYALRGDDRVEAFRRLSAVPLPAAPAVVQGLVAHLPAKVVVRDDEVVVIVSSSTAHHLRDRVLGACADLAPSVHTAARPTELAVEEGTPV